MPRSSGQKAMPVRAIASEDMPTSSRPSKRTEPRRCSTMPMIDFSVVVLPTPLRPRSVTTSPGCTSKRDAVQNVRLAIPGFEPVHCQHGARLGWRFSIMAGPEIGFAHGGISRYGLVIAFGEHLAAGEHRNAIAQIRHYAEIMLDHQHGARGGNAF